MQTHSFSMKIAIKRELQQVASNQLFDIVFKVFIKIFEDYTKEPFRFLMHNFVIR